MVGDKNNYWKEMFANNEILKLFIATKKQIGSDTNMR